MRRFDIQVVLVVTLTPLAGGFVDGLAVRAAAAQATGGAAPKTSIRYTDVAPRSGVTYRSNNDFVAAAPSPGAQGPTADRMARADAAPTDARPVGVLAPSDRPGPVRPGARRKYFPQPMCGGVAVIDFDNDGDQDLFFTNGAKLPELKRVDPSYYSCLLRNKGNGTFENVTAKAGLLGEGLDFSYGVAAGDFDNDGFVDLFLCQAGRNVLYRNNGDGTFEDVTVGSGLDAKEKDLLSVCAAWFDYDNDGRLDLVVSQYTYWNPAVDVRCPFTAGEDSYCHPRTYKSVPHNLYHNEGGGRFKDVTRASGFGTSLGKGMGIGIADFNNDDLMDVFVANDTEQNFLYINLGRGQFREDSWPLGVAFNDEGSTVSGMGADAKDYDNDGWVDIFYNNLQNQIWALFRNLDGRQFRYASPTTGVANLSRKFSGWSNGFVDYDNDGWKDIYSSNGDVDYMGANSRQHDTLFRNLDGARFVDVSQDLGPDFLRLSYQRGSAFGDLNNDGFLDLVVTTLNEVPRILLSSGRKDNPNHWLLVETTGRKSNRDGIGAKLKLTTSSGRTLYNHVTVSTGFMSSSDRRVHFGLGPEATIAELEIRWPGGAVQRLADVKVDQVLKIVEPQ